MFPLFDQGNLWCLLEASAYRTTIPACTLYLKKEEYFLEKNIFLQSKFSWSKICLKKKLLNFLIKIQSHFWVSLEVCSVVCWPQVWQLVSRQMEILIRHFYLERRVVFQQTLQSTTVASRLKCDNKITAICPLRNCKFSNNASL